MINLIAKLFFLSVIVGAGFSFVDAHKIKTTKKAVANIGIITKADLKLKKSKVKTATKENLSIVSLNR